MPACFELMSHCPLDVAGRGQVMDQQFGLAFDSSGRASGERFADSAVEKAGFEISVPRAGMAGTRLLTLYHEELIGCGFGAPDLALAAGKLPHAGVAVG